MSLLLALAALASDHDIVPPQILSRAGVVVPPGPPIAVGVAAGGSIQAAIDAAPAGSTITLAPGVFHERVVVDRPLVLMGGPGVTIDGGGSGTVLVVASPDVTVRDLRITGGGAQRQQDDAGIAISKSDRFLLQRVTVDGVYLGIDVLQSADGVLEGCVVSGVPGSLFGMRGDGIRLWEADRNVLRNNRLENVRDLVVWYSEANLIQDNFVVGSRYGAHLMHASGNRIEGNTFTGDVVGVFVMYSADIHVVGNLVIRAHGAAGVGLGFKESDRITVEGNTLIDNTTAIYLDTTPHDQEGATVFRSNLIGANDVGVRQHGPSQGARFEGNDFLANRAAASVDGRADTSQVAFEGNRWSDYQGYDLDGDGAGDLPYVAREVTGRLAVRRTSLAYFAGTPAAALLDLFAAAFPMFAPTPVLTDHHPRLGPWAAPVGVQRTEEVGR